jgi:hypothetical protein
MKLYYTVPKIHEVVSSTVSRKATKLYPVYIHCPENSRSCIHYTVPKSHEAVSSRVSQKFTKLYPVHCPENSRSCIQYTILKILEVISTTLSRKATKLCTIFSKNPRIQYCLENSLSCACPENPQILILVYDSRN